MLSEGRDGGNEGELREKGEGKGRRGEGSEVDYVNASPALTRS